MKFKNCIGKGLLVGALALSLAVPAYAATNEATAYVAREGTRYISYGNLALTNGNIVYTSSGENRTGNAYVTMNNSSTGSNLGNIWVATYPSYSTNLISSSYLISQGSAVSISDASNYPGQNIRLGFIRDKLVGTHYISGKFYYNGL